MKVSLSVLLFLTVSQMFNRDRQDRRSAVSSLPPITIHTDRAEQRRREAESFQKLNEAIASIPRSCLQRDECIIRPDSVDEFYLAVDLARANQEDLTVVRLLLHELLEANESEALATARLKILLELSAPDLTEQNVNVNERESLAQIQGMMSKYRTRLFTRIQRMVAVPDRLNLEVACQYAERDSTAMLPVLVRGLQQDCPSAVRCIEKLMRQDLKQVTEGLAAKLSPDMMQKLIEMAVRKNWIHSQEIVRARDEFLVGIEVETGVRMKDAGVKLLTGLGVSPTSDLCQLAYPSFRTTLKARLARISPSPQ